MQDVEVYILFFVLINSLINVVLFRKQRKVERKIYDIERYVRNGFLEKLYEVNQEELSTLGNSTENEKCLWQYFQTQISDVYNAYRAYKIHGISVFADNTYINILNANGRAQLERLGLGERFRSKIDDINRQQIETFLQRVRIYISTMPHEQHNDMIVSEILRVYRLNIRTVLNLFLHETNPKSKAGPVNNTTTIHGNNNTIVQGADDNHITKL